MITDNLSKEEFVLRKNDSIVKIVNFSEFQHEYLNSCVRYEDDI